VTYSNAAKQLMLGVPGAVLASQGAVSRATAEAMAAGALVNSGVHLAVSITGIAGPGGGLPDKPVGSFIARLLPIGAVSAPGIPLWQHWPIPSATRFGHCGSSNVAGSGGSAVTQKTVTIHIMMHVLALPAEDAIRPLLECDRETAKRNVEHGSHEKPQACGLRNS